MFAKLLKHEWKAVSGTLSVLSLCALGAGAVTAVMVRIWLATTVDSKVDILGIIAPSLLLFVGLGLVVYSVGAGILLLLRFYRNKFTDEGYLTFTLPAKSWEIFLSSMVNTLVWMLIIGLVVCASVAVIVLFGLWDYLEKAGIMEAAEYLLDMVNAETILNLVMSLADSGASVVLMMCCITMASVVSKKSKLLLAVAMYYGVSMVRNIVSTTIMALTMWEVESFQEVMTGSNLCNVSVSLLLAVGGYFLSVYLMDHKLNLP